MDVTTENLTSAVLQAPMPVMLLCYADGHKSSMDLIPVLERLVSESKAPIRMAKLSVDQQPQLAMQLQIKSVPTVFGLFGGRVVDGFHGPPARGDQ